MTIVLARKFDELIVMLSDTMISDIDAPRPNVLPGRIKAVVISRDISIAFAGAANQGRDAIVEARRLVLSGSALVDILELLRATTETLSGQIEFLVASHSPHAELRRISDGGVSKDLENAWIGSQRALGIFEAHRRTLADSVQGEFGDPAGLFIAAFKGLFLDSGTTLDDGVGGIPIVLWGSRIGHCYLSGGGAASWDHVDLRRGRTAVQEADLKTGLSRWAYTNYATELRAAPVLGLYIEAANIGWIYEPLQADEAEKLTFPSYPDRKTEVTSAHRILIDEIDRRASLIEGGFPEPG